MTKEEKQQIVDFLNRKIKEIEKSANDFEKQFNHKSEFLEGVICGIADIAIYGICCEDYKRDENKKR